MKIQWACIGHNPTRWALGRLCGNLLADIIAYVHRNPEGDWSWQVGHFQGKEPSRETAMGESEKQLPADAGKED